MSRGRISSTLADVFQSRAGGRSSRGSRRPRRTRSQPRRMSLAACMTRWPSTTRRPWWSYRRPGEGGEDRRLRLLGLQEQRVGVVAAEEQHDPRARPDAADADDLARDVGVLVAVEQLVAVGRRRRAVASRSGRADPVLDPLRSAPSARSSTGTMSGGSRRCAARRRPRARAWRTRACCLRRAFVTVRSDRLTLLAPTRRSRTPRAAVGVEPGVPDVEHRASRPTRASARGTARPAAQRSRRSRFGEAACRGRRPRGSPRGA